MASNAMYYARRKRDIARGYTAVEKPWTFKSREEQLREKELRDHWWLYLPKPKPVDRGW